MAVVTAFGTFSATGKPRQLLSSVEIPHDKSRVFGSGKNELSVCAEGEAGEALLVTFIVTKNPNGAEKVTLV